MLDDPMTQTPIPNQPMLDDPQGMMQGVSAAPGVSGIPSLKRRRDLEDESSDAGPQGNGKHFTSALFSVAHHIHPLGSRRKRSIVIDVPEDDGLILDKLSDLEAQMAHMESAIRLVQMKQTTLEAMIARILDILQPNIPQ